MGGTDDATSRVVQILGEIPSAGTMRELGMVVARALVPDEGEGSRRYTVVSGPSVGDLGEITIDAEGLLDDSILGYRLHVFAHLFDQGEGFVLKSVERTLLCSRGVSGELCV
ncbi:hypothetical protein [Candidatus Poriferisocius sp.]|uniref:hypothetical protein n=1 Tax=Candidatus Poriferisocius sp. TaxID=3101276 RepID=UPI003B5CB5A9